MLHIFCMWFQVAMKKQIFFSYFIGMSNNGGRAINWWLLFIIFNRFFYVHFVWRFCKLKEQKRIKSVLFWIKNFVLNFYNFCTFCLIWVFESLSYFVLGFFIVLVKKFRRYFGTQMGRFFQGILTFFCWEDLLKSILFGIRLTKN